MRACSQGTSGFQDGRNHRTRPKAEGKEPEEKKTENPRTEVVVPEGAVKDAPGIVAEAGKGRQNRRDVDMRKKRERGGRGGGRGKGR